MGEADPYQLLKREEMSRGLRLFLEKVWLSGFVISFAFVLATWAGWGPWYLGGDFPGSGTGEGAGTGLGQCASFIVGSRL